MEPSDFTVDSPGELIRIAGDGYAFVPAPLPPSTLAADWTLGTLAADADHALGRLDGAGAWLSNPYLLISPVQRREAILSSRIEGTITVAARAA